MTSTEEDPSIGWQQTWRTEVQWYWNMQAESRIQIPTGWKKRRLQSSTLCFIATVETLADCAEKLAGTCPGGDREVGWDKSRRWRRSQLGHVQEVTEKSAGTCPGGDREVSWDMSRRWQWPLVCQVPLTPREPYQCPAPNRSRLADKAGQKYILSVYRPDYSDTK